jgi:hypothetical protein
MPLDIPPVEGDEFVVSAPLHNAARLDNENAVSVSDRAHVVRDHESRSSLDKAREPLEYASFRLGIECRRGLVHDENLCISNHGACDPDALTLSSRPARRSAWKEQGE